MKPCSDNVCQAIRRSEYRIGMFLLMGLVGLWGCDARSPSGFVRGTVLVGTAPLTEAIVLFCREDGATVAKATVEPSGEFAFSEPVPVGHYRVQVESTVPLAPPESGETLAPAKRKFPEKYQYSHTSGLAADVKPGENSFMFTLQ